MDMVLEHFPDKEEGGFFDTADDHEQLVSRPKNLQDNATPCGNSMAVRTLLLLAAYTGQVKYQEPVIKALVALQKPMAQYPGAFAHWLGALEFTLAPPKEVAIIGQLDHDDTKNMLRTLQMPYRPNQVVATAGKNNTAGHPQLVKARPAQNGKTTAYVCQNFTCNQPVTTVEELEALLKE
jgi:uncharacterized protein YyaL (SSP411 family)